MGGGPESRRAATIARKPLKVRYWIIQNVFPTLQIIHKTRDPRSHSCPPVQRGRGNMRPSQSTLLSFCACCYRLVLLALHTNIKVKSLLKGCHHALYLMPKGSLFQNEKMRFVPWEQVKGEPSLIASLNACSGLHHRYKKSNPVFLDTFCCSQPLSTSQICSKFTKS